MKLDGNVTYGWCGLQYVRAVRYLYDLVICVLPNQSIITTALRSIPNKWEYLKGLGTYLMQNINIYYQLFLYNISILFCFLPIQYLICIYVDAYCTVPKKNCYSFEISYFNGFFRNENMFCCSNKYLIPSIDYNARHFLLFCLSVFRFKP